MGNCYYQYLAQPGTITVRNNLLYGEYLERDPWVFVSG